METTLNISFEMHPGRILARWDRAVAEVDGSRIYIGHLGCKLLGTLAEIPQHLALKWNQEWDGSSRWKSKNDSKKKLAQSLNKALEIANLEGAVLWDTMRSGSDYWRPGKLLLDSVEMLAIPYQDRISYAREDSFCPPKELLQEFMKNEAMRFGDYAEKYSRFLRAGQAIPLAMASVLFDLSRNKLPIFYCVDPYIPHYAKPDECCSDLPYDQRYWLHELRTEGCHRVILVEEIVKVLLKYGVDVKVIELNPTFEESYLRHYQGVDTEMR